MRSLKHINAYLCLHGKRVSKGAVDKFLSILQSDIKSGKITKAKDKFHKEADRIQRSLVGMSNAMFPGEVAKVEIEIPRKKHYEGIISEQGLGFMPLVIGAAVGKLTEVGITKFFSKDKGFGGVSKDFGKRKKDVQSIEGIDEISLNEAKSLGITTDGLGFVEKDIYKNINKQILTYLETETDLPWRKPWRDGYRIKGKTYGPQNYVSTHPYRGANAYIIALMNLMNGTDWKYFLTKKQIHERGGKINIDAKPIDVFVFIKGIKKQKNKEGKVSESEYSGVIGYQIYPLEYTTGVKPIKHKTPQPEGAEEIIIEAETLIENMPKKPVMKNDGGNKAFYSPSSDSVHLPLKKAFDKVQKYYGVAFHELVHSTGHAKRIGRDLKNHFGSKKYAFEELIAEIGSAYLCGVTGIEYYTLNNSAAYIKNWASELRSEIRTDKMFLFRAILAATRASKYIIGETLIKKGEVKSDGQKPVKKPTEKKAKPVKPVKKTSTPVKKVKSKKVVKKKASPKKTKSKKTYPGKAITPNKGVKANVQAAIKDLLTLDKYKNYGAMFLGMFYSTFKNNSVVSDNMGDMKEKMFEKYDFDLFEHDYHANTIEITESGKELLKAIQGRLDTLKAKKSGTDLFPELGSVAVKQPLAPVATSSDTRMKASDMKHMTFERFKFNPYYTGIFGSPAVNFDMCIHAGPGTGKTVFLLQFANYLAKNHGPVLYVTTEEYGSSTLVDKIERFGIDSDNLYFEKKLPETSELKKYKFIFIDSVNHAKINCEDYKKIRENVPNSAFILILQQTKGGAHKGGNDWPHEVEIAMRMFKDEMNERWLDIEKDRYDNPRTVKILN